MRLMLRLEAKLFLQEPQPSSFQDVAPIGAAPTGEHDASALPTPESSFGPLGNDAVTSTELLDAEPSLLATDSAAESKSTGSARSTSEPAGTSRALSLAWLRATLTRPPRYPYPWCCLGRRSKYSLTTAKVRSTISTRREDDRLAVAVGFSDSNLRTLASASAERIQTVLQEHFGFGRRPIALRRRRRVGRPRR